MSGVCLVHIIVLRALLGSTYHINNGCEPPGPFLPRSLTCTADLFCRTPILLLTVDSTFGQGHWVGGVYSRPRPVFCGPGRAGPAQANRRTDVQSEIETHGELLKLAR